MSDSRIEIYESYGINWMWYLEVERIDDDTVRFVREWRVHKFEDRGEAHPKAITEYEFESKDGLWLGKGYMGRRFQLVVR